MHVSSSRGVSEPANGGAEAKGNGRRQPPGFSPTWRSSLPMVRARGVPCGRRIFAGMAAVGIAWSARQSRQPSSGLSEIRGGGPDADLSNAGILSLPRTTWGGLVVPAGQRGITLVSLNVRNWRSCANDISEQLREGNGLHGTDILAVQEHLLRGEQSITEVTDYVWFGTNTPTAPEASAGRGGTGFLVRSNIIHCVSFLPAISTPRQTWLCVAPDPGLRGGAAMYVCSFYAPQGGDEEACVEAFAVLTDTAAKLAPKGSVAILGDFNAHVGTGLGPTQRRRSACRQRQRSPHHDLARELGLAAINADERATGRATRRSVSTAAPASWTQIDFALVSHELKARVLNCDATWLQANTDHCPVRVRLHHALTRLLPQRAAGKTARRKYGFQANFNAPFD